jgi:hypothetical protein
MALAESSEVIGLDFFNASLINFPRYDVPCLYELPQPGGRKRVELVIVGMGHWINFET